MKALFDENFKRNLITVSSDQKDDTNNVHFSPTAVEAY